MKILAAEELEIGEGGLAIHMRRRDALPYEAVTPLPVERDF